MTREHPGVIFAQDGNEMISEFWLGFRREAARKNRRLLFPESSDERVVSAAFFLAENKIARPVLVGNVQQIRGAALARELSLEAVEILDPSHNPGTLRAYADKLYEKRKDKGLTWEGAAGLLQDPLYYSCMALKEGSADGVVAGAVRTTADTVRAGFSCLGLAAGASVFFGLFFLECPHAAPEPRVVLFADAAVSPHPSPRSLSAIGSEAAKMCGRFLKAAPKVAFLSFSTAGSAADDSVSAVRQAVAALRQKNPALAVDGEFQGDTALNETAARQKGVCDSPVAGRANVLIFPDLNSGNISYKLVQYLGGARAVGPLLIGLSKPMTDLSRGCTEEDIVDAAALVSLL